MSATTIQRQSIVSTLVIFLGFGFGALNLIFLQPKILTTEQWGLTRVIAEAAVLLANFATLGSIPVNAKFFPFYKRYLPKDKIDLPALTATVFIAGLILTLSLLFMFKPWVIQIFGKNNALFGSYYYTLFFFLIFQGCYIFFELFAWFAGRTILSNTLKELLFRVLTTVALLLLALRLIDFDGFMLFFGFLYLPLVLLLVYFIRKNHGFPVHFKISRVTHRLRKKMVSLGAFVFLTTLSQIAFIVCDTLFLAGIYNLQKAGIYAVAQYFSQVLEVPIRSMQSSSIPLISEYWRAKNMVGLQSVYRKSCLNLLIAGMGLGGLILINLHNIERFFPAEYAIMTLPIAILVVSRWINLGTGLNAIIIQLSTFWRFDFFSTLTYSLLGIPLNFILITHYGMVGAALANVIAMFIYNGIRFLFLYWKFGLQPFTTKNLWVLLGGAAIILGVFLVPALPNLFVDGLLRSAVFVVAFVFLVVRFHLSEEVDWLWDKWVVKKILKRMG